MFVKIIKPEKVAKFVGVAVAELTAPYHLAVRIPRLFERLAVLEGRMPEVHEMAVEPIGHVIVGKLKTAGAGKGTIILQVNDQKMNTVEDWEEAVKSANQSTDRTLWIKALTPSGRKVSYVIDLNE